MKGSILDFIRSMTGAAIKSDNDIVYTNPPSLSVLASNGLVTKAMLLGYISSRPAPYYLSFLSTDTFPYVITGAAAIMAPFGNVPSIIVREFASSTETRWRSDIQPKYNPIADTLTIDEAVGFNGDITIDSAAGGGTTGMPIDLYDMTSSPYLTSSALNAVYPGAVLNQWVKCANINTQYQKQDNSPTGVWATYPYNLV